MPIVTTLTACCPGDFGGFGSHPSALVIVTDTTRADLGGAPWPVWATPSAGARVYTHAWSASPYTTTSTTTLLTGLAPLEHGMLANPMELARSRVAGPIKGTAIADLMISDNRAAIDLGRELLGVDSVFRVDDLSLRPKQRAAAVIRDALRRAEAERPDVLYVQPLGPHLPLEGGSMADLAAWSLIAKHGPQAGLGEWWQGAYRAAVLDTLAVISEPIEQARAQGSLVVWTSDHGEALGEDGMWEHAESLHDAQLRVPLVVWGPGVVPGWDKQPVPSTCVADTVRGVSAGQGCDLRIGRIEGALSAGMRVGPLSSRSDDIARDSTPMVWIERAPTTLR